MAIKYNEDKKTFHLNTSNTSYVMGVICDKYLLHLYYGKKVDEFADIMEAIPVSSNIGWSPIDVGKINSSTNLLPMEYPCYAVLISGHRLFMRSMKTEAV